MPGDYTRFSFNPARGFSGVRKQQGRVSLDSDFNEFEEILDRRDRAEMYDIVGQAVVPLTTQDGFEISVAAGKLMIGIGRAYVDGILAECFGDLSNAAATVRDDRLGGVTGPGPVAYDKQPFFYQPGFPALSTTAGAINLVYLDVWQREVTVFEDEALREPALNGPDTATRVQTAWQVKVMQGADASSCGTPPAAWTALTAPSTARLTAQAAPAVPAAGPCIINPTGGYTGLENRLYRVEIHKAGTLGGTPRAQLKWSRDNASLTARVLSIVTVAGKSTLTVSSTGRDAWMRFEHDNHIELLDDDVELAMREKGIGGPMARVLSVNHATGEIHIDQDLSAFAVNAARHPRIRRWDTAAAAEPLVRDANNGTPIPLEEGISITFGGAATDTLHAGAYWVFAARTADGTIETLVNAPPRGILHHFMRLALVTSGTPPTVLSDCRRFWPENCCCCTVEVGDGVTSHAEFNDIAKAYAAAVSRVRGTDTTIRICILPGDHLPSGTIVIDRPHVTISGCGRSSRIHAPGNIPIFEAQGRWFRLEHVYLSSARSEPLVRIGGVGEVRIEDNIFQGSGGTLLSCERTFNSVIYRNSFWGVQAIRTSGWGMVIAQNRFLGSGSPAGTDDTGMINLVGSGDLASAAWVLDNQLSNGFGHGIILTEGSGPLFEVVIAGNQIRGMRGSGIATASFSDGGVVSPPFYTGAASLYIDGLRIEHNTIEGCAVRNTWTRGDGAPQGGIVVGGVRHLEVADNQITGNGANQPESNPVAGIYVGHGEGVIVRDNVVTGNGREGGKVKRVEGAIVALDLTAPTTEGWPAAMVHGNLVVSPSGRALTLLGIGPMQVTDNRLIARELFPISESEPTGFTGAVLIETSRSSLDRSFTWVATHVDFQRVVIWSDEDDVLPSGDGNVIFSDNEVILDKVTQGIAPARAVAAIATRLVIMIKAADDIAFHDNVVRCIKSFVGAARILSQNTYLQGTTMRATGNAVFEDGPRASFPSLYLRRPNDTEFCTVTNNQVSHCIVIDKRGTFTHVVTANNLEVGCGPALNLVFPPVEGSRWRTLGQIGGLKRAEEESLRRQKAALIASEGSEDPWVSKVEERLQDIKRQRENIEIDLRMAERSKEIEPGDWALLGRVLDPGGRPVSGARLELWEGDRRLTEIRADERGEIFARYPEKKFKDVFKRAPQLKVLVKAADGKLLRTLEQTVTPVVNRMETFELRIGAQEAAPETAPEPPAQEPAKAPRPRPRSKPKPKPKPRKKE